MKVQLLTPFLLLLLSLLAPGALHAQVGDQFEDIFDDLVPKTDVSNAQLKALRQDLKIQKIFLEGIKGIEIKGGDFTNVTRSSSTIKELVMSSFEAKSEGLPRHVKSAVMKTARASVKGDVIQKVLLKTRDFIYRNAASKGVMMTSVARRFGFDVGLVYLLSLQVDLTFPLIMISQGHLEYAALLATPVSSIATGSYTALKGAVRMKQLVKSLGGIEGVRGHLDTIKRVKSFFKTSIIPQFDIVDIKVGETFYAMTIERPNLLSKIKNALGWSDRLNYKNVVAALERKNLLSPLVKKIAESQRPDQVKLLRVLWRIELEGNEKVIRALKTEFGSFINELEGIPDFFEGRRWAARISTASNFDEFARLMMNIPDEIPPRVFDKLWRHHIIPEATKNVGPFFSKSTYRAFRDLINNWDKDLRKQMSESVESRLNGKWKEKITEYYFKSTKSLGCGSIFTMRGDFAPLL